MADVNCPDLDLREQVVDIDQILGDAARRRHERELAPWQLVFTDLGAGAAVFAAEGASFKLLGH